MDYEHKCGELLKKFETTLRNFVSEQMQEKVGPKWWRQRVPSAIRENCRRRRETEEARVFPRLKRVEDPIHYTDLGELKDIIVQGNNFKEVFQQFFVNDANISTRVSELIGYRNPSAHNRPVLGLEEYQAIRVICRSLFRAMKVELPAEFSTGSEGVEEDTTDSNPVKFSNPKTLAEPPVLPIRETIAPEFIGRQEELNVLNGWLEESFSPLIVLAGEGGQGKTTLAYEFAASTSDNVPENLEMVIWLSAKVRIFDLEDSTPKMIDSVDFFDLDSALGIILKAYREDNLAELDTETKLTKCREWLTVCPALVVLDDIDSLDDEPLRDVMGRFVLGAVPEKTKVVITSRRELGKYKQLRIKGFAIGSDEGIAYVKSQLKLLGLEPEQYNTESINQILRECDGNPLYVQDLLRLCKAGEPYETAISLWKEKDGQEARKYALKREFEMLNDRAEIVLTAACAIKGETNLDEIEVVAKLSRDNCKNAIKDLQELFLFPVPTEKDGVAVFSLNENTKRLVQEVQEGSSLLAQIKPLADAISGYAPKNTPKELYTTARRARTLAQGGHCEEAIEVISTAKEAFPDQEAFVGATLAWIYMNWVPSPRLETASEEFKKAATLKLSEERSYLEWWDMERGRGQWPKAAEAAEAAEKNLGAPWTWAYRAGLARSEMAKNLSSQTHFGRAREEAVKAEEHYSKALRDSKGSSQKGSINRKPVFDAHIANYERLIEISRHTEQSDVDTYKRRRQSAINDCSKEFVNVRTDRV